MTKMTLRGFIEACIGYAKGIIKKTNDKRVAKACGLLQQAVLALQEGE